MWELPGQVRLSLALDPSLVGAVSARRPLSVPGVQLVHPLHSLDDFGDRGESHRIEAGVVSDVDEELGRPASRPGHGEGDTAPPVGLDDPVVGNRPPAPGRARRRIPADPELGNEPVQNPKEATPLEEAAGHEFVEAVDSMGRPWTAGLDDEVPPRGLEADTKGTGGAVGGGDEGLAHVANIRRRCGMERHREKGILAVPV